MKKVKILFVSHDATTTGAPILLYNLIKLLISTKEYEIKILVKNTENALQISFNDLGFVHFLNKNYPRHHVNFFKKIYFRVKYYSACHKAQKLINESDYVISNTITNGDLIENFDFSNCRALISYIHELEIATQYFTNKKNLNSLMLKTNFFLVPSIAVKKHLETLKIDSKKIDTLNYYIPINSIRDNKTKKSDELVIGMIGTLDWRKGVDLVSVLLKILYNKYPNLAIKFTWQGANLDSIEFKRLSYEIEKIGLLDKIEFRQVSSNVSSFYNDIDVLLLLSKEDPYPLVVIEAASYGIATICFDKAGGAAEFVEDDAGYVIPYLDLNTLCDTIADISKNRSELKERGNKAFQKYLDRNANSELIIAQFNSILANTK